MENKKNANLSTLIISLLKGIVYRDNSPDLWYNLTNLIPAVNDYAGLLGLECIIDEAEGYAYFKQKEQEEGEVNIPRLVQRRALSYQVSLLSVLLRKKILESDSGGESLRVILTKEQIIDMMHLYMPDATNEIKMSNRILSALAKIIDMGFARVIDEEKGVIEVHRILKAFVDADWISSLDKKIEEYRNFIYEESK